jgi:hypothetical protein
MNNTLRATAILAVLLATGQAAADTTLVSGDARGRAILDVVEGKAGMVAISGSYEEALGAARRQAMAEGKRFGSSSSLRYLPVNRSYGSGERLGVVTLGAPSEEAQRAIARMRSPESSLLAGR